MARSASTFNHNDRVEAFWASDSKWYPAQVLKVKGNGMFLVRFDGFPEKHDLPADQLRAPMKSNARGGAAANQSKSSTEKSGAHAKDGRGGTQQSSAKGSAPTAAPLSAAAPTSSPPTQGPQAHARRLFEEFSASAQRPSRAENHYAALEVAPDSRADDISKQFRRMSLRWHADRAIHNAGSLVPADMEERSQVVDLLEKMLKPVHDEEIRFLNEVKDTLTDPQERANYDAGQAQSQSSAAFGRGLDDFLNQAFASGATGSFTFNSNGGFAQNKPRASKHPKADRHNVQMQRGQQQPATMAQLQEQVQLLQNELLSTQTAAASEAEKARSDLCAAEQQATATIAQLQEQVQALSMDLCTKAAALEEFQVSMTAASATLAQAWRVPKAVSAKVCSLHVRDYLSLKLKAKI